MKKTLLILISIALILGFTPHTAFAEGVEVNITSISTDCTGHTEIIGYVSGEDAGSITCLVYEDKYNKEIRDDNIVYIDQVRTGNNNVFMISFNLSFDYTGKELNYKFGNSFGAATKEYTYKVPRFEFTGLDDIPNNSAIYGRDAYSLKSTFLKGEYVLDSIGTGGNVIYYKVGDNWYNLLDKDARSNEFLKPENAASKEEIDNIDLRYFYAGATRYELTVEGFLIVPKTQDQLLKEAILNAK